MVPSPRIAADTSRPALQRRTQRAPASAVAATAATASPCAPAQRAAEPGRAQPITPPEALLDITEPNPMNDMADPTPSALATLQSERALPIEPTESTLPTDPIESTDPRLAMLRNESSDAMDHLDDMSSVCRAVGSARCYPGAPLGDRERTGRADSSPSRKSNDPGGRRREGRGYGHLGVTSRPFRKRQARPPYRDDRAGRELMAAGDHHHHDHVDVGSIETAFARPQARLVELATAAGGAAEGLDQASCGAKVKYLAEVAIGESLGGGTPQTWRATVLEHLGPAAQPVVDEAEACMHSAGLWPWN